MAPLYRTVLNLGCSHLSSLVLHHGQEGDLKLELGREREEGCVLAEQRLTCLRRLGLHGC